MLSSLFFSFPDTATTEIYTLSLHDALPILIDGDPLGGGLDLLLGEEQADGLRWPGLAEVSGRVTPAALRRDLPQYGSLSIDRKSTRLNSSHMSISYAVFCLKKKKKKQRKKR